MPLWLKPLVIVCLSVGTLHAVVRQNQAKIDRFFMGVFRDLGRHKAWKRRHGNSKGLMTTLMHQDDPLQDILEDEDDEDSSSNLATYTLQELLEFGDGLEGRPILIAILGRVYDVSSGERFYGPDGSYSVFAGRDVTYALSTGCRTQECVEMSAEGQLSDKELLEGKRWLSFFHLHDKYPLVGKLEGDPLEEILEKVLGEENNEAGSDEKEGNEKKKMKPPIFQ